MAKPTLFFLVHITSGTLQCTIGDNILPTAIAAPPLPLIECIAVHRFAAIHLAASAHLPLSKHATADHRNIAPPPSAISRRLPIAPLSVRRRSWRWRWRQQWRRRRRDARGMAARRPRDGGAFQRETHPALLGR